MDILDPDAIQLLLLQLPYQDVLHLCSTDTYINYICRYDRFWQAMVARDFGPEVIQYKPGYDTYRDQYIYLLNPGSIYSNIDGGRLDALQLLFSRERPPRVDDANRAARAGEIPVLDFLEQRGILPNIYGARGANVDILNWLSQRGITAV